MTKEPSGLTSTVRHTFLTNQWIVPHNAFSLLKFNCHINIEACATVKCVKYLYKYFFKCTIKPWHGQEIAAFCRNDNTQLAGWFLLNQRCSQALRHLYIDISYHYVWQVRNFLLYVIKNFFYLQHRPVKNKNLIFSQMNI